MDIPPGGESGGYAVGGRKGLSESHMIPATIWATNLAETLKNSFTSGGRNKRLFNCVNVERINTVGLNLGSSVFGRLHKLLPVCRCCHCPDSICPNGCFEPKTS